MNDKKLTVKIFAGVMAAFMIFGVVGAALLYYILY